MPNLRMVVLPAILCTMIVLVYLSVDAYPNLEHIKPIILKAGILCIVLYCCVKICKVL